MKFLRNIFYFFYTPTKLYKDQPSGTLICLPVALYNTYVFKCMIPPNLGWIKWICKCDDMGTETGDIPKSMLRKLGLTLTTHTNVILKKGGILIIKNGQESECDYHAVFCYPNGKGRNNKKVYTFINLWENVPERIVDVTYKELEPFIVKGKKNIMKGYYLN